MPSLPSTALNMGKIVYDSVKVAHTRDWVFLTFHPHLVYCRDCKVPYTYKPDPALAKWVSQQRAQQAQGRLAPDRKAKLDAIDFSWKLNTVKNRNTKTEDKKWMRQYDKLVAFHSKNGHCRVPDRYKEDRPLGTWVKKQRLANACQQLKPERKQMLDNLGFQWRITDKTDGEKWDRMYVEIVHEGTYYDESLGFLTVLLFILYL